MGIFGLLWKIVGGFFRRGAVVSSTVLGKKGRCGLRIELCCGFLSGN